MTDLAALNAAVQADRNASKTVKAWIAAATPLIQPPPSHGTGLGLLMYRGALNVCSHLSDGTYDLVIGSWGDPELPKVSGEAYAYTVLKGTPGADTPGYVVLDPANPAAYLYTANTLPAGVGVFLDNTLYNTPGLPAALATVHAGLASQGRKLCVNAGAFIAGDPRSNDGTLWSLWATQLVPVADRIMLEHWQEVTAAQYVAQPRERGASWWELWDQWQLVPKSCQGKFVGITYGPSSNAIYGRASLLLSGSPGVFIYNTGDGIDTGTTDPYSTAWTVSNPSPKVNPVAPVSASL